MVTCAARELAECCQPFYGKVWENMGKLHEYILSFGSGQTPKKQQKTSLRSWLQTVDIIELHSYISTVHV